MKNEDASGTDAGQLQAWRFVKEATVLREALLDAQFELADRSNRAVLILLNGADGAGKGQVLNRLHEWLDPRTLATLAYDITDRRDQRRPPAWPFWRDLPQRGRIGVMIGSWYHTILLHRATGGADEEIFHARIEEANRIESMLDAERVTLLKFWLQLSDSKNVGTKIRTGAPPGSRYNPLVREWVEIDTKKERKRLVRAARELILHTADSSTPWHIVEAEDPLARDLEVGRRLLDTLQAAARWQPQGRSKAPARPRRATSGKPVLPTLDLSQTLDKDSYETELADAQARIFTATQSKAFRNRALIVAFEGNDAAGKGGTIRRLRSALNPVHMRVHPIGAPSDEERARPFLWRFWHQVPLRGNTAIYDRSWYGRVLVERVEGFAAPAEWTRAYGEINDFEAQLTRAGYIVHKFWLAIDEEEQLRRFEERKETPHKRFKITDEDWRNRAKWPLYAAAVEDMVALTSTEAEPWTLVESNSKRFSRVKVLRSLADRLEDEL
ncbi:polyphosphate:AMP phosphotransferase [Paracoccus endophyticus]|uniref:polyphosphate:AMP phosphotransferase n=1 Tax=Paracoccus endophyticus TaxID=2233774 RepID=UPI000DD98D37|nr:polyphosphate:AMP phosphotransferase [Paracoccus endophyticus]